MDGKKLKEARRLCAYANESFIGTSKPTKVSNQYLVSVYIKDKVYSYPVDLSNINESEEKRNQDFAKFICNCIIHRAGELKEK